MRKPVLIELSVKMLVEVADDWQQDNVEFWLNESSHCLDNEILQIADTIERRPGLCTTCYRAKAKVLNMEPSKIDIDYFKEPE